MITLSENIAIKRSIEDALVALDRHFDSLGGWNVKEDSLKDIEIRFKVVTVDQENKEHTHGIKVVLTNNQLRELNCSVTTE